MKIIIDTATGNDNVTTLVASSSDANFPAANLLNNYPTDLWKADTGVLSAVLDICVSKGSAVELYNTNAISATVEAGSGGTYELDPPNLNQSTILNDTSYPYSVFTEVTAKGFHAEGTGALTWFIAATSDSIDYVSGRTYTATFTCSEIIGTPPKIIAAVSSGGAPVTGVVGQDIVQGANTYTFVAGETVTGVIEWYNLNTLSSFTISDFKIIEDDYTISLEAGYSLEDSASYVTTVYSLPGTWGRLWADYPAISTPHVIKITLTAATVVTAGIVRAGNVETFNDPAYGFTEDSKDYSVEKELNNGADYFRKGNVVRTFSGMSILETRANCFKFKHDIFDAVGPKPLAIRLSSGTILDDEFVLFAKRTDSPKIIHDGSSTHSRVKFSVKEVV